MSLEVNKHAHPRHHVVIDISSADYDALTDGKGRSIPFTIDAGEAVTLSVKLADSTAFEDYYFNAGDNPPLVIAVEEDAAETVVITAGANISWNIVPSLY